MNALTSVEVKAALQKLAHPALAKSSQGFFKTGKGQYGEGDVFIGVTTPALRKVVRQFRGISLTEILKVLKSPIHEERHVAVLLLVDVYEHSKNDPEAQERVVKAYLRHLRWVDNWDIVDSSAHKILGNWLLSRERSVLFELASSERLWTRRVAMVATWELTRHGEMDEVFALAERLLTDREDLMHKATGWMLREAGKRGAEKRLKAFLREHAVNMPRTMLRYAIEKFPAEERKQWLSQGSRTASSR